MFVFTLGVMSEETVLDLIEHRALETTKLTFFADVILHFGPQDRAHRVLKLSRSALMS